MQDNLDIGTFDYMPSRFLGLDTSEFGESYHETNNHPFLKLYKFALDETVSFEDRIQCIRYMCFIPYKDNISYCIKASKSVISNNKYDIYNRFYFFSNNAKNTKLEGHVIHSLYPYFFELGLQYKYPLELILMAARYIFSQYDYISDERNKVLDYLLDVADDKNETIYARSECADILLTLGEGNEIQFGYQIIQDLGQLYDDNKLKTIYTNAQNAHDEQINDNTRTIVKALYKDYLLTNTYDDLCSMSLETIQNILYGYCKNDDDKNKINKFLYRIMTDPFRFERLSLFNIFILVYLKIQKINISDIYKRLFEEAIDCNETCTTGYFTRIVNTLNGYIDSKELNFKINPKDELRSVIFARLNTTIQKLPKKIREHVIDCIENKNFNTLYEFIDLYFNEEEIRSEYKDLLTIDEFNQIFNKCIDEYIGKY